MKKKYLIGTLAAMLVIGPLQPLAVLADAEIVEEAYETVVAFDEPDDDGRYTVSPEVLEAYLSSRRTVWEMVDELRRFRHNSHVRYDTLAYAAVVREAELEGFNLPYLDPTPNADRSYYPEAVLLEHVALSEAWIAENEGLLAHIRTFNLTGMYRPTTILPDEDGNFFYDRSDWTFAGLRTGDNLRFGPSAEWVHTPMNLTTGNEAHGVVSIREWVFVYEPSLTENGYVYVHIQPQQNGQWQHLSTQAQWIPIADIDFENTPSIDEGSRLAVSNFLAANGPENPVVIPANLINAEPHDVSQAVAAVINEVDGLNENIAVHVMGTEHTVIEDDVLRQVIVMLSLNPTYSFDMMDIYVAWDGPIVEDDENNNELSSFQVRINSVYDFLDNHGPENRIVIVRSQTNPEDVLPQLEAYFSDRFASATIDIEIRHRGGAPAIGFTSPGGYYLGHAEASYLVLINLETGEEYSFAHPSGRLQNIYFETVEADPTPEVDSASRLAMTNFLAANGPNNPVVIPADAIELNEVIAALEVVLSGLAGMSPDVTLQIIPQANATVGQNVVGTLDIVLTQNPSMTFEAVIYFTRAGDDTTTGDSNNNQGEDGKLPQTGTSTVVTGLIGLAPLAIGTMVAAKKRR